MNDKLIMTYETEFELIAKSMMRDIMQAVQLLKKDALKYQGKDLEAYAAAMYCIYNLGRCAMPYAEEGKEWFPMNAVLFDDLVEFMNDFEKGTHEKNNDENTI